MNKSDPKASRAGHPGEGVESICVPGYREGDELSDEELRDGLIALAAIAQDDGRDEDADILLEARDRIERQSAELTCLGKTRFRVKAPGGRLLDVNLRDLGNFAQIAEPLSGPFPLFGWPAGGMRLAGFDVAELSIELEVTP